MFTDRSLLEKLLRQQHSCDKLQMEQQALNKEEEELGEFFPLSFEQLLNYAKSRPGFTDAFEQEIQSQTECLKKKVEATISHVQYPKKIKKKLKGLQTRSRWLFVN